MIAQIKKSNIKLLYLCILTSLWLIMQGCSVDNKEKLADFYSLIDRELEKDIESFISEQDTTEQKMYCKLLCLKDHSIAVKHLKQYCDCPKLLGEVEKQNSLFNVDGQIDPLKIAKEFNYIDRNIKISFGKRELLSSFENFQWDGKSDFDLYNELNYLLFNIQLLDKEGSYDVLISYINYGFYLIEINNLDIKFPKIFAFLNLFLGYYFIQEDEPIKCMKAMDRIIELDKKSGIAGIKHNALLYKIESDTTAGYEKIKIFQKLLENENISSEMRLQFLTSILSKTKLSNDVNFFNELVTKVLSYYDNTTCDKFENQNYIFIADNYIINNDLKKAQEFLSKVKLDDRCSYFDKEWSRFYLNSELSQYYNMKFFNSKEVIMLDSALFYLKKQLDQYPKIFSDLTIEHLDDSSMDNAVSFLRLISSYDKIPIEAQEDVINYLDEAKSQELKIDQYITYKSSLNAVGKLGEINKLIGDCNIEIEKLGEAEYYKSDIHKIKFDLINEREEILSSTLKSKEIPGSTIDLMELKEYLKETNTFIIEYAQYEEELMAYGLSAKGMEIANLHYELIDSLSRLCHSYPKKIKLLKEYSNQFIPFNISKGIENILILRDGILNDFSFDLLDLEKSVVYHHDLADVLTENEMYISYDSIGLMSFSDLKTKEKIMKREHSDLIHGYRSMANIDSMLGLPEEKFIKGENFTYKEFLKNIDNQFIHLVTHAIGDTNIQNNGMLIFRGEKEHYDSVSTNTLDYLNHYPDFIYLDACQSGIGKNYVGEGNYSIDRVFLKNGTSTVIKTLWSTNDESAALMAVKYYEYWVAGKSCSEALREAKKDVRAEYTEPYHWAPYVLEGNPNVYLFKN